MNNNRYKMIYISPDLHAVIKGYCEKHGDTIGHFANTAFVEALTKRGMARRWDGERWIWYEVETTGDE